MARHAGREEDPSEARAARRPEVDWLKGFAILCVLVIHAQLANGTFVFDNLINRAVPIFVVLFGATSELWWRRHAGSAPGTALARWYGSRWRRLMIPVWGMLLVWWPLVTLSSRMPLAPRLVVASLLGYLPWIGTAWFVTLVLELVVVFPLLHAAVEHLGARASLALTLVALALYHRYMLETLDFMRWLLHGSVSHNDLYYLWIFPPAWFFSVTCGIVLARQGLRVGARGSTLCVALVAASAAANAAGVLGPRALHAAYSLSDPALTWLLLATIPRVRRWPGAARALAWLGMSSWGLYVGQMLLHDACGGFGYVPGEMGARTRWAYFAALLAGSTILVVLGSASRNLAGRLAGGSGRLA